jgi:hypothetical protein
MTKAALQHIEVTCKSDGCVVVGVARDGGRIPLSALLSPFVARDHAAGKAEFFGCAVINADAARLDPTRVRTQRWPEVA